MRSLQPQTSFGLYNFIVNTSKRVLFLPPSDAYVRSFLYLLYTLIKLYYTKALSDQASSLAPDWILLLQRPRIPASFRGSATTFQEQAGRIHILRQGSWIFPKDQLESSGQFSLSVMSDSLWPHGLKPAWLLCFWNSSGKNTGVGCHFLL